MKKIKKILIFSLVFAFFTGFFTSCDENVSTEVTEELFEEALNVSEKNLSIDLYHEYDGDSMTAAMKIVDNKVYYMSQYDYYWFDYTDHEMVQIIESMADKYSSFTYSEGAYTASELTYTYDDYDYTIVNVSLKVLSSGNLSEIYFEVPEEDCNRIYKLTFKDYNKTSAPSADKIYTESADGGTSGGDSLGTNDSLAPDVGAPEIGAPDINYGDSFVDITSSELDEKEWYEAFNLDFKSFYARLVTSTPKGDDEYQYILHEGVAYYTNYKYNGWSSGDTGNFTDTLSPFQGLYSEFTFDGKAYYCAESSFNPGESGRVIDLYATFDAEKRLVKFSFTLELNGECGTMTMYISSYNEVKAPDTTPNSGSSGSEGGGYTDGAVPDYNYGQVDPDGTITIPGDGYITTDPDAPVDSTDRYPIGGSGSSEGNVGGGYFEGEADGEESYTGSISGSVGSGDYVIIVVPDGEKKD